MKNKVNVLVIGAGAGGLGAAAWLKLYGLDFMVVDYAKELPKNLHNGVHYLHSIPKLPFQVAAKEIVLTDGILTEEGIIHQPNLKYSLQYSEKVRELQHPSSIMSVGKRETVFMPMSNTVNTLLEECYNYAGVDNFNFGYSLVSIDTDKKIARFKKIDSIDVFEEIEYNKIVSTLPLDILRKTVNIKELNDLELKCSPVYITNFELEKIVPNWMINIYIPDLNTPLYRASVLNGICSVESIRELNKAEMSLVPNCLSMFHFKEEVEAEKFNWSTGKVISISNDERFKVIERLREDGIYSIGRFGLWNRKLLIDSTINQAKLVVDCFHGSNYWSAINKELVK